MDYILQEDIEYIAQSDMIDWDMLKGKSVLVTGATGLIGSQIVLALDRYNQLHEGRIKIYALARNEEKAARVLAGCSEYVRIILGDIKMPIDITEEIDYIIHGASMTSSKEFVDYPVETILTGMEGTDNVLRFADSKKVKGMVYLSSLEVYGVTDPEKKSIKENEYGYIEQMVPRSSYSEGKRMAECLCISYGHEYGVPVKIVRLSQTFGPGVSYSDNRVFAQFARCAIENQDIVLKTKGETYRNYCYIRDAVTGILCVLLKGNSNEAYNIANKDTGISICDMAHMIADDIADKKINVVFDIADDIAKLGYGPTIKISLDTDKIEQLGWKAEVGLKDAFERMIQSMRCSK
ncbi:NAD-dependent epimerase/dehydratase family protein [Dorea ammoniilytica]